MFSKRRERKQPGFRLGNGPACGSIGVVLKALRQRRLSGWLCLLGNALHLTAAVASPRLDVSGGLLRQTSTQLTQSNADHHEVQTYYDAAGRLVKLERVGPDGNTATETWAYPDARTVVHTPGPGPVLQPVTRTLSADGLTLTVTVGARDASRQRRETQGGKLVLITEIKDDSDPAHANDWTAVGTQEINPANGQTSFTPWDLTAAKVEQTSTLPAAGGTVTTLEAANPGGDSANVTLDKGLPTTLSGTADGVGYELNQFTYDHGRLTGASGTLAGKDAGFALDADGRIARLWGAGFDKHYTYGGAPKYTVTVSDSVQGTTQTLSASEVGDFEGISGDGVQPVSASTQDLAGGVTQTNYAGWLSQKQAADGSVLRKDYTGLTETTGYTAEGLPTSVGTGSALLTLSHGENSRSTSGSGFEMQEEFYHAGPRKSVSGSGEARSFTYQRLALASETHTAGPWAGKVLSYGQDGRGRRSSLSVSGGLGVNYGYAGGTSRLVSVSAGGTGAAYSLNATTGQRDAMQRGALSTSWSRDAVGRVTSQATGSFSYGSGYDARHRRTSRSASSGVGWSNLQYDAADRLTSAHLSNGTTLNYAYDTRGNRLAGGSAATTYTVNALNQATTRNTSSAGRGYGVYGTVAPGARVRVFHPGTTDPQGEELAVDPVTASRCTPWPPTLISTPCEQGWSKTPKTTAGAATPRRWAAAAERSGR